MEESREEYQKEFQEGSLKECREKFLNKREKIFLGEFWMESFKESLTHFWQEFREK